MTRSHWLGLAIAAAGLAGLLLLASTHPAPLGDIVDPLYTPPNIKPEWYFLWLYGLINVLPERIGVLVPAAIGIALAALPFVHPAADGRAHRIVSAVALAGGFALVVLTLVAL